MPNENITIDDYDTPEQVFLNLIKQYKNRLERISSDLTLIKDPEIYGFANKLFLKTQKEYFYLLSKDLELAKLFENKSSNQDNMSFTDEDIPNPISEKELDNMVENMLNNTFNI